MKTFFRKLQVFCVLPSQHSLRALMSKWLLPRNLIWIMTKWCLPSKPHSVERCKETKTIVSAFYVLLPGKSADTKTKLVALIRRTVLKQGWTSVCLMHLSTNDWRWWLKSKRHLGAVGLRDKHSRVAGSPEYPPTPEYDTIHDAKDYSRSTGYYPVLQHHPVNSSQAMYIKSSSCPSKQVQSLEAPGQRWFSAL
jgi:hypothetical protein